MSASKIIVPVILFASLTSLVRTKFGNKDADIYSEIEKAEAALNGQKDTTMSADRDSFATMTGLTKLKYGNHDADVYNLVEEAETFLS